MYYVQVVAGTFLDCVCNFFSQVVGARHPFVKDSDIEYDIDSDEEWEEVCYHCYICGYILMMTFETKNLVHRKNLVKACQTVIKMMTMMKILKGI